MLVSRRKRQPRSSYIKVSGLLDERSPLSRMLDHRAKQRGGQCGARPGPGCVAVRFGLSYSATGPGAGSSSVLSTAVAACGTGAGGATVSCFFRTRVATAFLAAARGLRVVTAFLPAARRLRVAAAFLAAARSFRVPAAFFTAVLRLGLISASVLVPVLFGCALEPNCGSDASRTCLGRGVPPAFWRKREAPAPAEALLFCDL